MQSPPLPQNLQKPSPCATIGFHLIPGGNLSVFIILGMILAPVILVTMLL